MAKKYLMQFELSETGAIVASDGELELWFSRCPPPPDLKHLPRATAFLIAMVRRFGDDPAFVDAVIAWYENQPTCGCVYLPPVNASLQ